MALILIINGVNFLVGIFSLALLARVLLPWFRVSSNHPVMTFLTTLTEPLVRPVRKVMGGGIRWTGRSYLDMAPLVTVFVLWLAGTLLIRLLYLILSPPVWLLYPGRDLGGWLAGILDFVFQLYILLILARVLLEWMQLSYAHPVMRFLWDATEPVLRPIRRRLPTFSGLDFTPLAAVLLLGIVEYILALLLRALL